MSSRKLLKLVFNFCLRIFIRNVWTQAVLNAKLLFCFSQNDVCIYLPFLQVKGKRHTFAVVWMWLCFAKSILSSAETHRRASGDSSIPVIDLNFLRCIWWVICAVQSHSPACLKGSSTRDSLGTWRLWRGEKWCPQKQLPSWAAARPFSPSSGVTF